MPKKVNRASSEDVWKENGSALRSNSPGDQNLRALIQANEFLSDVSNTIDLMPEELSPTAVYEAIDAYNYFGLTDVADLLQEMMDVYEEEGEIDDTIADDFQTRYEALGIDAFEAFEQHYESYPEEYEEGAAAAESTAPISSRGSKASYRDDDEDESGIDDDDDF